MSDMIVPILITFVSKVTLIYQLNNMSLGNVQSYISKVNGHTIAKLTVNNMKFLAFNQFIILRINAKFACGLFRKISGFLVFKMFLYLCMFIVNIKSHLNKLFGASKTTFDRLIAEVSWCTCYLFLHFDVFWFLSKN